MSERSSPPAPSTEETRSPADRLDDALERERAEMAVLADRLRAKLSALRSRDADELESSTVDLSQAIQELDRLSERRRRRMDELARALDLDAVQPDLEQLALHARSIGREELGDRLTEWRNTMRDQAETTQELCEQVAFGLQYAAAVGQEMLEIMRGVSPGEPASTYSRDGDSDGDPSSPSFVNRLG